MKRKRIIVNVLIAFIIVPIMAMIFDYFNLKKYGDKLFVGTYFEYEKINAPYQFFGISPLFLLFILLPYNYFILKKDRSLFSKILILELIFLAAICLAGSFFNIWTFPYWTNLAYVAKTLPLSCLFAAIIHFAVDRYEKWDKEIKAD